MNGRGRPELPLDDAWEFGQAVIRERKEGESLKDVFARIRRGDPRRWGSVARMWRLWRTFGQIAPGQLQSYLDSLKTPAPNGALVVRIISVPSGFFLSEEDIEKAKRKKNNE